MWARGLGFLAYVWQEAQTAVLVWPIEAAVNLNMEVFCDE